MGMGVLQIQLGKGPKKIKMWTFSKLALALAMELESGGLADGGILQGV